MALDPEFVKECFYLPEGLLNDEVDIEQSRVVARMPTHAELPLTRMQRVHPTRHPRHVSGGSMIHMTGIAGMVHAYYVLGLRHSDGWVGYGGAIHKGRFKGLAPPGEPILISCRATKARRRTKSVVARYDLCFTQGDEEVYRGDHTAMRMKVDP